MDRDIKMVVYVKDSEQFKKSIALIRRVLEQELETDEKLKKQRCYTITGKLAHLLPEECVAELEALHQRMKSQQRPLLFIQLRMLQEVVELLWAFYIHINLENLWLPGGYNRIDE